MKNQPLPNDKSCVGSQISVSCYNVLDRIFPNVNASSASEHTSLQNRLMIEDVFHCQVCNSLTWPRCFEINGFRTSQIERILKLSTFQARPTHGIPFCHSAHVMHGRLNLIVCYNTAYVGDQRNAFMIRDETVHILRMAVMEE